MQNKSEQLPQQWSSTHRSPRDRRLLADKVHRVFSDNNHYKYLPSSHAAAMHDRESKVYELSSSSPSREHN